ncbi:NADPH cytochrome P450 oxidoreductase family protein [Thalassobaculum sp. OXR-137]|uniref:NADPH cytochrome P450 oxidoreductase family protein n=1 Tax=Thalassobaculum sp. OXR-137 TaxID=3100173 RepID=UPI002AC9C617|nr:NADPH cytochrome P450 oxidoreductase family protein [Thalassobaculum sp. OXR-137]WPZ35323.1 NADPH cytochrome P450 oxidoreductase family protein [Thalassobaculum sp. OXR-137]
MTLALPVPADRLPGARFRVAALGAGMLAVAGLCLVLPADGSAAARALEAGAAVALYLAFCCAVLLPGRSERSDGDGGWLVVHASQTGTAADLAAQAASRLAAAGLSARLVPLGEIGVADLAVARRALFVVATTGEGEPPDPAIRFHRTAMAAPADLSGLDYALVALGDSDYPAFCGFGRALDSWLQASGARPLTERAEIDAMMPASRTGWTRVLDRIAGPDISPPAGDGSAPWRIDRVARQSTGPMPDREDLALVRLVPEGPLPDWGAGDVAEISVGDSRRDYTIASLPAEGGLSLVVRPAFHPDGSPGLGTGLLTATGAAGRRIGLRIRANPHLRCPPLDRPMLLIGAGSGIAGIRAQLAARIAAGGGANWVVYGDRLPATSTGPQAELLAWHRAGWIGRLDLAFSRGDGERCRVPDRLRGEAETLRDWLARDAVVYVCGGADGIGASVHALLVEMLGEGVLQEMAARGDYRRDVY